MKKKNIAIIVLSVCLAVTILVSVALCLYLPRRQARLAERVWAEYMSWYDYIGCDSDFDPPTKDGIYPSAFIRCLHSEAFDQSLPAPEGDAVYTPTGNYIYHIYIYSDGSGILSYQQWGHGKIKTEDGGGTYAPICFHKSETPLTAEEVQSVLTVMDQHDFGSIPTQNLDMDYTHDASSTYVVFDCSVSHDRADWKDHLITAYSAEEGAPCYEIRKAIEALIIAHDAGPIPETIRPAA
ncbi:MAG: hypothetical protein IJX72_00385 [Clostridia bacterium]|nr:hypothetical protein [Clostridia bacterium]